MAVAKTLLKTVNRRRRAGLLLHPTSLPGPLSNGDIGHEAYRFIEFLHASGFKVWQMLPLGATYDDKSPYQCSSAHAGNPLLISLDWLEDIGWLKPDNEQRDVSSTDYRLACLQQAAQHFYQMQQPEWTQRINEFSREHADWLDDYALFMALKKQYLNQPWYEWPEALRNREKDALENARQALGENIKQNIFEQFVFFTQWHEVRQYAREHDIEIFGDTPIFVAKDSADVWAQRENFLMDGAGEMTVVSGVPPDAFSETGQRWGNPLYDWDYMQKTDFAWWKARIKTQLALFDIIRFDHFRGLEACWQIPQEDETAINGKWAKVPGKEMLSAMFKQFDYLPLVAEDLGVITDEVIKLKNDFNLPGMKVLQFAFDGNNNNPHLPHCHEPGDVVYTGTHDNDTTLGWLRDEQSHSQAYFSDYLDSTAGSDEQQVLSMIRLAMSSVAFLSVIPMQDLLLLDTTARMNTPGTVEGNWLWRFDWQQVRPETVDKIHHFMMVYRR